MQKKTVLSDTLLNNLFTKDILNSKRRELPEVEQLILLNKKRSIKTRSYAYKIYFRFSGRVPKN